MNDTEAKAYLRSIPEDVYNSWTYAEKAITRNACQVVHAVSYLARAVDALDSSKFDYTPSFLAAINTIFSI